MVETPTLAAVVANRSRGRRSGAECASRFQSNILESERITGPWRLLSYLHNFGEQAYFVNIPSKFIAEDGRVLWLMYAANFTNGYLKTNYAENPPGSGYGMCVQEVELSK